MGKIKSWDQAFRSLIPEIRQQSARVADYTQVLFAKACEMDCYTKGITRPAYLFPDFTEVAYKCGLYHQIGKAMLPPENQLWRETFTKEERDLYRSFPNEGVTLVTRLQGGEEVEDRVPISCLMIRYACGQNRERWDGSGYPHGLQRDEISLIGQIVSMARDLDSLATEIHSEMPFEEAMGVLSHKKGTRFSDNLIETMKSCRNELKEVYLKYIQYTNTVPKTIPLVERRPERPFGLRYQTALLDGEPFLLYEAVPWFMGVGEEEGQKLSMEQVEAPLERISLQKDISLYLLYEAADTILRLNNWKAASEGILIPVFGGFYRDEEGITLLKKLLEDQNLEKQGLKLAIPISQMELAKPYLDEGFTLVLDEYHPKKITIPQIQEAGFSYVRITKTITDAKERAAAAKELQQYGIFVIESTNKEKPCNEEDLIRRFH